MDKKWIRLNHLLIQILIIAQPIIIMFQAMVVRDIQLFGLSVFESFNIFVSGICICLTICTHVKKKIFLKYIPVVIVFGCYLLVHIYNTYQFNNTVYPVQNANFLVEAYYIVRTFVVPLLLLFNIYYSGIEKEKVIKTFEWIIFITVFVMVITNFLGVALRNYSEETLISTVNIFDWFTFENISKYSYYSLTTKGWFLSGNQMSAVLFMSFPIIIYRAYKLRDKFHYGLVVLQMLAMFMLGTKVANMGCLLLMGVFFVCWGLFALLKQKKKGILTLLIICLVFVFLFPFSPVAYMYRYQMDGENTVSNNGGLMLDQAMQITLDEGNEQDEQIHEYYENLIIDSKRFKELNPDSLSIGEKEFVKQYIANYCGYFGISSFIIENYNDLEHSVFWTHYLQETPNNDYRVLKTMILKDIYIKNNNPLDKFVGMGYTLNYIYTEADYSYQFYSYGIFGIILLVGPYFMTLLYVIYKGLRNFKEMFTLECAMCFFGPLLGLCVAKFSGHVLERGFPLLIISVTMGILLLHTKEAVAVKKEN